MSLINRYGPCWGLTVFKWSQLRAEIWYIPAGYEIVEHSHPQEDVELMYLAGNATFFRRDESTGIVQKFTPKWPDDMGRCFSVFSTHSHWFSVSKWPLVFINFQKFLPSFKPVSAARDFKVTTASNP